MNWFVSPFNSLSLYQLYPLIPRICPLSIQPSIKNSLACHVWCAWGVHAGVFYCFLFGDSLSWFFESLSLRVHNPSVDRWILSSFLIVVFFCVSSVFTHHVHFFSFRFVSFLFFSVREQQIGKCPTTLTTLSPATIMIILSQTIIMSHPARNWSPIKDWK